MNKRNYFLVGKEYATRRRTLIASPGEYVIGVTGLILTWNCHILTGIKRSSLKDGRRARAANERFPRN